jgi:very-short-patch-repair endonuclease
VAEGRGGVVRRFSNPELVSNLQPTRGMKRRRFIYNPKTSKDYRRQLRRNLTPAEAVLWRALQNSGLEGKKFRRQHGIGPYIADFYCPECRLIVELDGAVHEGPLETERDEARTTYLRELGIRVIRFENRAVFESLELVLNSIRIELQENLDHTTPAFGHPSSC